MSRSPLAGRPAPAELLIDPEQLERAYHERQPDVDQAEQLVSFGTSGHRGSPDKGTFTEAHILAITQAICDYRRGRGITGPLYMGKDTHCLSAPAQRTALEVLAANGARAVIQRDDGCTPTPVISRAILVHNRGGTDHLADGIVIAPPPGPPGDGGLKYNAPDGGPADTDAANWIEERANEYLLRDNAGVKRVPFAAALSAATTRQDDFAQAYVDDLRNVIDVDAIRGAGLKLGADPLGGTAARYWQAINRAYGLNVEVVNPDVGHDGRAGADCSSPGTAGLVGQNRVASVTNPGADRHEIVTPSAGLMDSDHYTAVAIRYLLTNRPGWPPRAAVGKTLVGSGMIDRVAQKLGRAVCEVPVGFQWFTPGLFGGSCCFGGKGSAASFLRRDGTVWTTDGDGLLLALLAAEITARTGKDPGEHYREMTAEFGTPHAARIDVAATPEQKGRLKKLSPADVNDAALAGEPIAAKWTRAPGNGAPLGGLKVVTASGWFAARPSGTADVYKLDAESFQSRAHLDAIVAEAQRIVAAALAGGTR